MSDGGKPYKARARFRDADGVTRTVARFGQTKGEARKRLLEALAERSQNGQLDQSTTVRQLARTWLDGEIKPSDRAARTKEHYEYMVERHVLPAIGALRLAEVDTRVVDGLLKKVAAASKSNAKTTRAVLNGMFRLAVSHGAATLNPVRESGKIGGGRKLARALTRDEADDLSDRLRTLPRALQPAVDNPVGLDLADFVDFMLGTGCRIGEVLAARHMHNADGKPLLDLDAGTFEINATVIRLKGVGLVVQERPKSAAGWRVLALPPSIVDMLSKRRTDPRLRPTKIKVLDDAGVLREEDGVGVVFPSPFAPALRDPSNLAADLREVLDPLGYDWVRSHTFRKTVATRLDEAGWSGRQIADQLGHSNPSLTLDRYMGRRVVNGEAAQVLER